jgi:drug/metabolite transporter (DMT)-like permease
MSGLWVVFTVLAAGGQTMRNALQRELTKTLGTVGATHVRFLYGLPFGVLFLLLVTRATDLPLPGFSFAALGWTTLGAVTQIAGTALLLSAMQRRSFVVATAYAKTEPVLVAIFGLLFLGDHLTLWLASAIAVGTLGVVVMSWPAHVPVKVPVQVPVPVPVPVQVPSSTGAGVEVASSFSWDAVGYGVGAAAALGLSAVGYRGGILALDGPSFVVNASTILVTGLTIQTVLLSAYLYLRDPTTLTLLLTSWRTSISAGFAGAFASQMWFLAFAIESAAKVRTLALIEIIFAQIISRRLFQQNLASREGLGIVMIVAAVAALLWP